MLFLSLLLACSANAAMLAKRNVISQYWAAYATGEQPPTAFPWAQADIANYFVVITQSGAEPLSVPFPQTTSDIYTFVQQAKANNVKPVVSLGGWTGGKYFSSLVSTQSSRTYFVGKIQSFVNTYGFEGVDIDWEYPNYLWNGNEISDADSANLLLFLQQLRTSLGVNPILSMAASMGGLIGPGQAPVQNLGQYAQYLDYLNLMTYDVTGSWSAKSGPNAPLSTCGADTSIKRALSIWTSRGFPANKILIGLPSYSISFTTASSTLATTTVSDGAASYASKFYQEKVGISPSSRCGGSSGYCSYRKMISAGILNSNGEAIAPFLRYFDQCTSVPFVFDPTTRELITYDDSTSVGIKSLFALNQGLAGMMVFDSNGFDSRVYSAIRAGLAGTFVPTATSAEPNSAAPVTTTTTTTTSAAATTSTTSTTTTAAATTTAVATTATPSTTTTPATTSTSSSSAAAVVESTSSAAPTTTMVTRTQRIVCNSRTSWSLCGSRCSQNVNVPSGVNCISGAFVFISNRQTAKNINCLSETSWQLVSTTNLLSGTGGTPNGVVCRSGAFVAIA